MREKVSFLPSIKLNYLYPRKSSTSQITTLLDKSLIEELTGWLIVNNREIVHEKARKEKNPRQDSCLG